MSDVSINVYKDALTGKFQLSIDDDKGGYRLQGPKFSGNSVLVMSFELKSQRDIMAIQMYLNRALAKLRAAQENDR